MGRFLSVDPLADAPLNVGTSPYAYVWNNPMKFIDPDGRHGEEVDWKPEVDDAGNLTYVSEEGDNYITFIEQYGQAAADKTFSENLEQWSTAETYGEGEVSLKGGEKIHSLILRNDGDYPGFFASFFGKEGASITNDPQQVYDHIMANSKLNQGRVKMDGMFVNEGGKNYGSFSMVGGVNGFPRGSITYDEYLDTGSWLSRTEGGIPGGTKYGWSAGVNPALLITERR